MDRLNECPPHKCLLLIPISPTSYYQKWSYKCNSTPAMKCYTSSESKNEKALAYLRIICFQCNIPHTAVCILASVPCSLIRYETNNSFIVCCCQINVILTPTKVFPHIHVMCAKNEPENKNAPLLL